MMNTIPAKVTIYYLRYEGDVCIADETLAEIDIEVSADDGGEALTDAGQKVVEWCSDNGYVYDDLDWEVNIEWWPEANSEGSNG